LAKSTLDLDHPYFQKAIRKLQSDPQFTEGLVEAQRLIEANHEACHRVVQPMGKKYPECHDRIWKYDWAPSGSRSATRKSWRMVVIVPDPFSPPYYLIGATVYAKSSVSELALNQLAAIFAAVTGPTVPQDQQEEPKFKRVPNGDGMIRSLCIACGESLSVSAFSDELEQGEEQHQCAGSLS
jgi:hypothetical protein